MDQVTLNVRFVPIADIANRFCLEFPLIGIEAETSSKSNFDHASAAPESGLSPDALDVRFVPQADISLAYFFGAPRS